MGEEFDYFAFGGSYIVMLLEKDKVEITAELCIHYNQVTSIAWAVK